MNLNKVMVIGRLTRDPEIKTLPSGIAVASFSLAVNNVWRDKDGNKKENAEFVNIVVFGNQAENCGQWLKKGQEAYVEGRLQTRSWDGEDGAKKYRTEVVADRVQFGSRSGGKEERDAPAPTPPGYMSREEKKEPVKTKAQKQFETPLEYPTEDINPEDIPF